MEWEAFLAELKRAIRRLPPKYHRCYVLHVRKGLSYERVSEIVGLPVPTVRTYTSRAEKLLEQMLRPKRDAFLLGPEPHTSLSHRA